MMGRMGGDAGANEDEDGVTLWVRVILGMVQVMKWHDGCGWDDAGCDGDHDDSGVDGLD